jgi:hypothetical protein
MIEGSVTEVRGLVDTVEGIQDMGRSIANSTDEQREATESIGGTLKTVAEGAGTMADQVKSLKSQAHDRVAEASESRETSAQLLEAVGTMRNSVDEFARRLRSSADLASPEEAKEMAEAAARHIQDVGIDQARKDFQDPSSRWIDRDLYVLAINDDYIAEVQVARPELIGENVYDFQDSQGKYTAREIVQTKDRRWLSYVSPHPITGEPAEKKAYAVRVGSMVVSVGAYAQEGH